jgi:regulatory protein
VRNSEETLQKARDYAFLLLKFRLRSEEEIYQRLKKKKFDEEVIKQTLSFLNDKGFIDDNLFAKAWIESRIKKPLGLRRIRQELNLKGIDKEIIDREFREIKKNYSEGDLVKKIAQERLKKLKGIEPLSARRRVYAYLLRRGFSPEIIIDALSSTLCRRTS